MAKPSGVVPAAKVAEMFQINLKNRPLAALLAWLVPGAGHLYQGRTAKGLLLMICITSTFAFGFYVGDAKVAFASPLTIKQMADRDPGTGRLRHRLAQAIDRWPFFCQAGVGSVAIPAIIERQRFLADDGPLFGGWFRPPLPAGRGPFLSNEGQPNEVRHPTQLAKWNYDNGFFFELGTIYTVIAGLLNILAVYDAYSGPLIPVVAGGDDNPDNDGQNPKKKKSKKADPADSDEPS